MKAAAALPLFFFFSSLLCYHHHQPCPVHHALPTPTYPHPAAAPSTSARSPAPPWPSAQLPPNPPHLPIFPTAFSSFPESTDHTYSAAPRLSKTRASRSTLHFPAVAAESDSLQLTGSTRVSESDPVSAMDGMEKVEASCLGKDSRRRNATAGASSKGRIGATFLEASLGAIRRVYDGVERSFKVPKAAKTSRVVRIPSGKGVTRKLLELSGKNRVVFNGSGDLEGFSMAIGQEAAIGSSKKKQGRHDGRLSALRSIVGRAVILVLWMLLLLYLLGTTASDYFSCTLEELSSALNLSPSLAGVTLLAVGNGAPDVFSSIMAFVSSDTTGSIGFGSVLGGALFITTVVAGAVSIISARRRQRRRRGIVLACAENGICVPQMKAGEDAEENVKGDTVRRSEHAWQGTEEIGEEGREDREEDSARIDLFGFVRDIGVLLLTLAILTLILLDGKVYLWEAIAFLAVYPLYVIFVVMREFSHCCGRISSLSEPLLKVSLEQASPDLYRPPQLHVHSHEVEGRLLENGGRSVVSRCLHMSYKYCIECPCALLRSLTIPMIEYNGWSRWKAVSSCTLAPVFAVIVWTFQYDVSTEVLAVGVGMSALVGLLLGVLSFRNTQNERPPQQFVWMWLAGGFFMSITWFYLVANLLVAALESLGTLLGMSTAVLALTVLAWGNSVGDLVADLALAYGDRSGAQIAISGCYAGPIFSIVLGLGVSLVVCSWRTKPQPYLITRDDDDTVFFIIGFLVAGLLWSLIIMLCRGMKLNRIYGVGLLLLYCLFLVVGLVYAL